MLDVVCVVLTAGRNVPGPMDGVRRRGEGVAIVLSGPAVNVLRTGGGRWKAWSSRLVTASLEIGKGKLHVFYCCEQRGKGGLL